VDDERKDLVTQKLEALKELTEERFKSVAMALVLQAEDYKRRLETISVEVERLRNKNAEQQRLLRKIWDMAYDRKLSDAHEIIQEYILNVTEVEWWPE
jgi:hypothetical protein